MMSRGDGVFLAYLATLGCSGEAVDNPQPEGALRTASVSQALTAGGLDGLCFHVARNEAVPRYATLTSTPDSDIRGRTPAALPDPPQIWCFDAVDGKANTYRIQEAGGFSYLDAHETSANDYRVVLRPYQANLTQEWIVSGGPTWFRLRQASSKRYLDSYAGSNDKQFVTRSFQDNETQEFGLVPPSPTSCMVMSATASATKCDEQVYCQYYPGLVSVWCESGEDEWNCACWYVGEQRFMTLTDDPSGVCGDAMDLCLAE